LPKKAILIILGCILIAGVLTYLYFNSGSRSGWKQVLEKRNQYASQSASKPVDFTEYFTKSKIHGISLQRKSIGRVMIKSGKIVASDPFYAGEEFTLPFTTTVPPGNYPVVLCFANLKNWGERVAFAQIILKEGKPVRWEMAKTTAANPADYFYGVDAGLGCFADLESAKLLSQAMREYETKNPEGNYYGDILESEFKDHEDWNIHYPMNNKANNVVMFSSGIGDGSYASYWGFNAKNEVICLVTDFQLFNSEGGI
jgi:hypothetical protein